MNINSNSFFLQTSCSSYSYFSGNFFFPYGKFFQWQNNPIGQRQKSSNCVKRTNYSIAQNLSCFDLLKKASKTSRIQASKIISDLDKNLSMEYSLDNYHRSNQDTCLVHKPAVFEGQWVQSGDLLADCSASVGGELSLGQNILIAYMPWEGYNFEDAILISERLVYDDLYTSIHIERYEVEIRETKLGMEEITRDIPEVPEKSIRHLHGSGIAKLGSWIQEGDILVGKVTPINKKNQSNYQKLLYTILEKPVLPVRDSSLRAPKGIKAKVIGIQIFKNNKNSLIPPKFKEKNLKGKENKVLIGAKSMPVKNNTLFLSLLKKYKGNKKVGSNKNVKGAFKESLLKWSGQENNNLKGQTNLLSLSQSDKKSKKEANNSFKGRKLNLFLKKDKNTDSSTFFNSTQFLDLYSETNTLSSSSFFQSNKEENKHRNRIKSFSYINKNEAFTEIVLRPEKSDVILKDALLFDRPNFQKFDRNNISKNFINFKKEAITLKDLTKKKKQQTPKGTLRLRFLNKKVSTQNKQRNVKSRKQYEHLLNGVSSIQIYLAEKRRIQVGDKMAGRHGNKGIISQILPLEDMPFLPDGTPLDMVLNPLGVPSRMNVGQIYECLLGLAGKHLGENYKVFPFDEIYGAEASRSFVYSKLYNAKIKTGKNWLFNPNSPGKMRLYDGRTGESFDQAITVGYAYMLRLVHMVDDKIHARSTGPYSLVTQQPLRGRSKQGGQRLGEMEVWALEGYGAAFTLLEMLTIKSDDMTGRMTLWSNLILNKEISIGTPESFKVLICELQALCLDIGLFRVDSKSTTAL